MADSKLRDLSTDFAVKVIKMCDGIKGHYSLTYAPFLRFYLTSRIGCAFFRNKNRTFVYDKCSVFVYPSRRLGISSPHIVRCISSAL